jgi:hypothetical protein
MADLGEGKSEKFPAKDWTTTQISEPGKQILAPGAAEKIQTVLGWTAFRLGNLF